MKIQILHSAFAAEHISIMARVEYAVLVLVYVYYDPTIVIPFGNCIRFCTMYHSRWEPERSSGGGLESEMKKTENRDIIWQVWIFQSRSRQMPALNLLRTIECHTHTIGQCIEHVSRYQNLNVVWHFGFEFDSTTFVRRMCIRLAKQTHIQIGCK